MTAADRRMRLRQALVACLAGGGLIASLLAAVPAGASFSALNGWIVLQSDMTGTPQIYAEEPNRAYVTQLTGLGANEGSNIDPNVSPDGTKVVFASNRSGTYQIYVLDLNNPSAAPTLLTSGTIVKTHPVWAPNGQFIAYAGQSGADSDVYRINFPSGSGLVDLTPNTPSFFDTYPAWSPGGIPVSFQSKGRDPNNPNGVDIYTVDHVSCGSSGLCTPARLTTTGVDIEGNWGPDNKSIVFASARDSLPGQPASFAAIKRPISLAFSGDGTSLLVTQNTTDVITAISSVGVKSTFATLPKTGGTKPAVIERYMAVAPAQFGTYPAGTVFVSVGKNIYTIPPAGSPDGSQVTLFRNLAAISTSNNFLLFDTGGSFNNNLLVVGGRTGKIYRLDSSATATLVVNLGASGTNQVGEMEGGDIAPAGFSPYGGDLIVAAGLDPSQTGQGAIWDVKSSGTASQIATWNGTTVTPNKVEATRFIPSPATSLCNFGNTGGALFVAENASGQIFKYPGSMFFDQDSNLLSGFLANSETDTSIGRFTAGALNSPSTFSGPVADTTTGSLADEDGEAMTFTPCTSSNPQAASPAGLQRYQIYTMRVTCTNATPSVCSSSQFVRLTSNSSNDRRPAWSPNQASIVFASDRNDPNQPGCQNTSTCRFDLYSMNATDGTSQTNVTPTAPGCPTPNPNPTAICLSFPANLSSTETGPDWQPASATVTGSGGFTDGPTVFTPNIARPKIGGFTAGSVMWTFEGPDAHTVTDNSFGTTVATRLFDTNGAQPNGMPEGTFFVFLFPGAGTYLYICTIHPGMSGTVKLPMSGPTTGTVGTPFTITWGVVAPPSGYGFDVQVTTPSNVTSFFKTGTTTLTATYTPNSGPGSYVFQARLRKLSVPTSCTGDAGSGCSQYSGRLTVTVS